MKPNRLLLVFLIPFFSLSLNAQNVTPKFKKLIFADYEIYTAGQKQHVKITYYKEINELGQLHLKTVDDDEIGDTTYRLPDSTIVKLNEIFNGSKPLKSYMKANKLPEGEHYSGPLTFVNCVYANGSQENFIWIYPFMNDSFNNAVPFRVRRPQKTAYKGTKINDSNLQQVIFRFHNACTYMLKIEQPPPMAN